MHDLAKVEDGRKNLPETSFAGDPYNVWSEEHARSARHIQEL